MAADGRSYQYPQQLLCITNRFCACALFGTVSDVAQKQRRNEENMKKSTTKKQKGGNSQSARLNQIVKRVGFIVITSIVLLLIFVGSNFLVSAMEAEQLENTMFLNQYRLGSKKLTSEVRAYAITSDQSHYDAYMKELNEDKNRDIAWDGLKKNRLSKDEWASHGEL